MFGHLTLIREAQMLQQLVRIHTCSFTCVFDATQPSSLLRGNDHVRLQELGYDDASSSCTSAVGRLKQVHLFRTESR